MSFKVLQSQAFTVTATSQELYPENSNRYHFSIQNNGAVDIFIHYGSEDATLVNGIKLIPTGLYESVNPGKSKITVISASSTAACVATEG